MLDVALIAAVTLATIWVGYPLLIFLISRLRTERETARSSGRARVSVILATLDSEQVIRERAANLLEVDYPAQLLEVVIAVDASARVDPAGLRFSDPRVKVIRGDTPGGKAATLNAAVRASTGEVLVFTDSAQKFEASTVDRLVASLEADEQLGVVSGALYTGVEGARKTLAEMYWICERWLRATEARVHSAVGVTGAVYALRRVFWAPLPAALILDDVFVPMRVILEGHRVGFCRTAVAHDVRRFEAPQEYKRKARTLTGVFQLCAWMPAVLIPWRNPIWAQFVVHKLLRLTTPVLLLILVASLAGSFASFVWTSSPVLAIAVLSALVAVFLLLVGVSSRVRDGVSMALAMQAATVRATYNAMRGRWDVWSR
jgi:cellulose synthase/poly-beta-1,6-N-acetylglucosamine synthase-like glycosyltransferase